MRPRWPPLTVEQARRIHSELPRFREAYPFAPVNLFDRMMAEELGVSEQQVSRNRRGETGPQPLRENSPEKIDP